MYRDRYLIKDSNKILAFKAIIVILLVVLCYILK